MIYHPKRSASVSFYSAGLLLLALTIGLSTSSVVATDDGGSSGAAAEALPSPEDLLKAAIKAQGGQEAFDAIKSVHTKSQMRTPMGNMDIETYFKSSGEFLVKQIIPQMGEIRAGYDGTVGWHHIPVQGYQLLSDDEISNAGQMAATYGLVQRLQQEYGDMKTVEKGTFGGAKCYKVSMVHKKSETKQYAYFDVANQRIAGIEVEHESDFGPTRIVMSFEQWKDVEDIKVFTEMKVDQSGMNISLVITEIEFNTVDDAILELPDQVKRLAAAQNDAENDD
jgi:hypothetical protein